jgi:hypothetical protein
MTVGGALVGKRRTVVLIRRVAFIVPSGLHCDMEHRGVARR